MFCKNCGKEIPNNTKFCNYCGAPQNNDFAQDTQPGYRMNETQQTQTNAQPIYDTVRTKKKKKGPIKIIAIIAIMFVLFVIGYFATGANKVKQPTKFDTPEEFKIDKPKSPSIKGDVKGDLPEGYTVEEVALEQKTFSINGESGESKVTFHYKEDGTVNWIFGNMTIYDLSAVDVIENLKNDAEYAEGYINELGEGHADSYVGVQDLPDKFVITYSFSGCIKDSRMAELGAAFLGFEAENGKITIDAATEYMEGIGYTQE